MPHARPARAAASLAIPTSITAVAMLVGWGFDDVPGFFANPARTGVFAVMLCEIAAGAIWGVELNPFRKGKRPKRGWPIVAGMFTVPLIWVLVSFFDRRGTFVFTESATIRWIGVAGFAAGSAIRLFALHELGRQYSAFLTVQTGHQLIKSGIYRRIRHPFYLGGLISLPGVLLAFRSPLSAILFAISLVFVVNRIGREERLLIEEFPTAYREYQNFSWRLVPHVY